MNLAALAISKFSSNKARLTRYFRWHQRTYKRYPQGLGRLVINCATERLSTKRCVGSFFRFERSRIRLIERAPRRTTFKIVDIQQLEHFTAWFANEASSPKSCDLHLLRAF
jgi:hypothetical protein